MDTFLRVLLVCRHSSEGGFPSLITSVLKGVRENGPLLPGHCTSAVFEPCMYRTCDFAAECKNLSLHSFPSDRTSSAPVIQCIHLPWLFSKTGTTTIFSKRCMVTSASRCSTIQCFGCRKSLKVLRGSQGCGMYDKNYRSSGTQWRTTVAALSTELSTIEEGKENESQGNFENTGHRVEHRLVSGERVLQISKADFTVSSVLDKIRRGKLDLRPSYQRDYVWDKRTASKLIESVLLNIPLPTMFFHEKSQGQLEVAEGKQRLTSIWSFMEVQKFPDGAEFALTGLEVLDRLNGMKYADVDESLREVMQDFALNVHTISRHSDDEVVFAVFERLNMGSTQLNEQELRNCVFQGSYNDLLDELASHPHMLKVFHQDIPHKRMRDREFILRFFALRRTGLENFYLPVKNWLNNERHRFLEEVEAQTMKDEFMRSVTLAVNVFGDQVFRMPRGPRHEADPNVCLWDTIMFGFLGYNSLAVMSKKEALVTHFDDLVKKDAEFKANLVSTPKALKIRTKKWAQVLRELLGSAL